MRFAESPTFSQTTKCRDRSGNLPLLLWGEASNPLEMITLLALTVLSASRRKTVKFRAFLELTES
ncbi:hypothetical protein MTBLM1_60132 [Rhodospirillaceae bacterium LM-1]|nr:hypothetical protein MTBLM1_60132 [Rhodospirillaceae bacterium LM-1]